jgi:hypothetical protein
MRTVIEIVIRFEPEPGVNVSELKPWLEAELIDRELGTEVDVKVRRIDTW